MVSECEHAGEELRLLRAVFEETLDAIVVADDAGRYVDANPAAGRLFGVDHGELVGRSISEFAVPGYDVESAWETFLTEGSLRGEFELVRPDDTRRTTEFAATADVVPGRHLSVLRDVTERTEYAARLERQNERLREFASILSHDLRNPLGVAAGWLDIARETGEDDAFDRVAGALGRMDDLVTDLLALARHGTTIDEPALVDLERTVREAWSTTEGTDVDGVASPTLETDDGLGTVRGDRVRLGQLFENLFRNAIEHGGEGVTVRVGRIPGGFYVEDDGPGIPEDARPDVFESGYTTAAAGNGLGLAIVRAVAEAHGWTVTAVEGRDGGARFEFTGGSAPVDDRGVR